jgi:glycosyltransferase involved in cell wall biosynthesis
LKVSLITVCFNSEKTIKRTIESVINQNYSDIEYIIVDGDSKDSTLSIIESYNMYIDKIISEKDLGMYYALNKGIENTSGDIIGIIHSDDIFFDNQVISNVVDVFNYNNKTDIVWGDIVFINNKNKIIRMYSGKKISSESFNYGIMPPHPSVFIKKYCYDEFGIFNTKYRIAADYDLIFRLIKINKIKYSYLPKILVQMNTGGLSNSSFLSILELNKEIYKIHNSSGFPISIFSLIKKIPKRFFELFNRP